jgi:hypothetical protein
MKLGSSPFKIVPSLDRSEQFACTAPWCPFKSDIFSYSISKTIEYHLQDHRNSSGQLFDARHIAVSVNIGTECRVDLEEWQRVKVGRVTPCAPLWQIRACSLATGGGQRTARPTCADVSISMSTAIALFCRHLFSSAIFLDFRSVAMGWRRKFQIFILGQT